MAEGSAPAPAPGPDGVIVAPPPNLDEVRKRLEERKRKQRERAETARAEAARRAEAAKTNPSAADAPSERTATKMRPPSASAERLGRPNVATPCPEVSARRLDRGGETENHSRGRERAVPRRRRRSRGVTIAEGEDPSKASAPRAARPRRDRRRRVGARTGPVPRRRSSRR